MRRLFSTFARGAPGVGLLLLRLVAGISVPANAISLLRNGQEIGPAALDLFAIAVGALLLVGLWTPISGSLLAAVKLLCVITRQPNNPLADILLVTIGVALALLGPGAWSYDARLFGWRRIAVRDRRS